MLRHSLAIDPAYGPAYAAMADLKHKEGKEVEAARYAADAARYQPAETAGAESTAANEASVQDIAARAGELYQGRQYPQALALFTQLKSVADQTGNAELGRSALNNIGLCRFQMGQLDSAAAVFEVLMAGDPKYVKAINNMAKVRLAQGRVDEAKRLFQRTLTIDPENRIALEQLRRLGK